MATYVPNATDFTEPLESQTVESAALEFRTLKARVNALDAAAAVDDLTDLRIPETSIAVLPAIASRAGKVLGFDAGGDPAMVDVAGATDPSLRSDLAASSGASLAGYLQTGAGAVSTTVQDKLRESMSLKDKGATGGGSVDDLAAVNLAISESLKQISATAGTYRITAAPTNPQGSKFVGPGKVLQDITIGGLASTYQVNSYTDDTRLFVGKEYLYRAYLRMTNFTFTSALSNLAVQLYGDSTVAGTASHTAPYYLINMIPSIMRGKGIPNITIANYGVAGTSVGSMDALTHLTADTDLIFIKYGINDFNSGLSTFSTDLRAKLAAIRATYLVGNLSIVLVGPNATYQAYGLTTSWYEDLRGIYMQASRDYQCAYFDTYALVQDARQAGGLWMDSVSGGAVHPENMAQAWIWGAVLDSCFPDSDIANIRTNNFVNDGAIAYPSLASTAAPTTYPLGTSIRRATVANGWPTEGIVITTRSVDEIVEQRAIEATPATSPLICIRSNQSAGATWAPWSGKETALSLQNSWVNFAAGSYSNAGAWMSQDKTVFLKGIISSGTVTSGTLLATLPVGMRPERIAICVVYFANGAIGAIAINPSGQITAQTALNSTYTSLDGVSFRAA